MQSQKGHCQILAVIQPLLHYGIIKQNNSPVDREVQKETLTVQDVAGGAPRAPWQPGGVMRQPFSVSLQM